MARAGFADIPVSTEVTTSAEPAMSRPMELFFYGTLMDRDVLGGVVGRPFAQDRLQPATLLGWRRVRALGQPYPIVLPEPAGSVDGVVVDRLGPEDVARLRRYEGEGYDLVPTEVTQEGRSRQVHFFRPGSIYKADPRPWDFAEWLATEKTAFMTRIARHLKA
jgi:hypothetical protein